MFGSFNIGTDYTFTQSEAQNNTVNKSKAISNYVGKSDVPKKSATQENIENTKDTETKVPENTDTKDTDSSNSLVKAKKDTSAPEIKILGQGQGDEDNNDYLYNSDGKVTSVTNSFDALVTAVGGVGGRVTKEQLMSYLQSLTSDPSVSSDNAQEVTFIKSLIAQFDTLSNDTGYITSLDNVKEPQDYTTVTKEQVTSPIDIRV